MSSASSAVTYTSVYSDSKPGRVFWGANEELSDGGSPRVIVYGYDGLPMLPVAPPSLDFIPGPKEPQTPPTPQDEDEHELMFIQLHDPDFMPEPIYPEYIPLEDEHILPTEEQPLPPEYEDDETEDGPVDHPMDGGDDEDDNDGDSFGYDIDDEDEDKEEEEEHLAPPDSAVVIPTDELNSISLPPEVEVKRLLAMPTPSPSPLTSLSPPSAEERLARCTTPVALPSPPLPPSLYPQPPVDRRDDIPESKQTPLKRLCLSTLGSREVGYGIRDTWIDPAEAVPKMAPTTIEKSQIVETLRVIRDMRREMDDMQAELLASRGQTRRAGQPGRTQIMTPVTKQGHNPAPPNTNTPPHHMTLESVQAMIDQALLRNSTNGDGSQSSHRDNPRNVQTTRPCFYANFMKFHPLNFKGNKGIIGTLGPEAYAMTWEVLKKKMTDKYCPQGELKKLEIELWNLKFVANENEKIDKYIGGLPDSIYRNVKSSKPKTLDETIKLTNYLMDQKLRTYAKKANNKKKADDTSRNNHGYQQQPFKKQNFAKDYNMGTGERKPYEGSLPKCTKCQRHHNGPCTQKCYKCNKVGHFARDYRSSSNTNVANAQKDGKETPMGNGCFECEASGHFKRDCPKLRNKNGGNKNAQRWVYEVGNAEKNGNAPMNPDSNVITGTFLLNNRYASILFDTGADRSFIATAFSLLVNIDPTPLGSSYDVELADGKIVGIDTILNNRYASILFDTGVVHL
nr:hypothetical protein [Tanacetum cinerariifolium]